MKVQQCVFNTPPPPPTFLTSIDSLLQKHGDIRDVIHHFIVSVVRVTWDCAITASFCLNALAQKTSQLLLHETSVVMEYWVTDVRL
jgi:hypothetical protein